VSVTSHLDVALESLTAAPMSWAPVLDEDRHVVGTLSFSDVVRAYRRELAISAERMAQLGGSGDAFEMKIDHGSQLAGTSVRQAGLPRGILITSIRRGDTVLVPNGDTLLEVGDCLALLSWTSAPPHDPTG
jgi:uncharacterized transporter YbjL